MKKFLITSLLITLIGCSFETDNTSTTTDGNTSTCGDSIVDTGEECDDGSNNSDVVVDACRTSCVSASCGDNVCDTDEDSSTCSNDCPDILSTSISIGAYHTCSIRNGELFCWGRNTYGQLGDGTNDHKNTPILIGNNSDWTHISLGYFHTCGIRNGQLFCWGYNGAGQLGDGTNGTYDDYFSGDKNTPTRIGNNSDWTHISLGYVHTCGFRNNGQLFCWGYNYYGQLGDGKNGTENNHSSADKNIPTLIGNNSDWTHISLEYHHTCGIRNSGQYNGQLFCWGYNSYGQLGDGTDDDKNRPILIGNSSDWTHISLGDEHTCGFRNGQLFCWGYNGSGQLGDGTNYNKSSLNLIGNNSDWTHISLGEYHTCGVRNGELFCWGNNNNGQLGDGTNGISFNKNTPTRIGNNSDWTHITLGNSHTCGFRDNQLFCWGNNEYGQLGDGTNGADSSDTSANKNTPTLIDSF